MYMYIYMYIYINVYIYIHLNTQACLSGRSQALRGAENFPGTVRAWICWWKLGTSRALPWEVPNRTSHGSAREGRALPPAQSGSDCAKEVCRFPRSFSKISKQKFPQKQFCLWWRIWGYSALLNFRWGVGPWDWALGEPNTIPYLIIAHL